MVQYIIPGQSLGINSRCNSSFGGNTMNNCRRLLKRSGRLIRRFISYLSFIEHLAGPLW